MANAGDSRSPTALSAAGRLKFLASDSVVYGLSTALSRLISFLTLPLLTRFFVPADYALIDLFTTALTFMTVLYIFGQDVGASRYFFDDDDAEHRRLVFGQSFFAQFGSATVLGIAVALGVLTAYLTEFVQQDIMLISLAALAQSVAMMVFSFAQTLVKLHFERNKFLIASLVSAGGYVALLLLFVMQWGWGIPAVFLAGTLAYGVTGGILLILSRHRIRFRPDAVYRKRQWTISWPYGLVSFALNLSQLLERSLVILLIGASGLGVYSASARLTIAINTVTLAFQTAWQPFSLAIHKEEDAAHTYGQVARLFALLMAAAIVGMSVIAQPVLAILVPPEYLSGLPVVIPLCLALALQGIGWILEIGILLAKRVKLQLVASGAYIVATFAGIAALAYFFGLVGAAFGVVIGQLVKTVANVLLAERVHPLGWPLGRLFAAFGLMTVWAVIWSVAHQGWSGAEVALYSLFAGVPFLLAVTFTLFGLHELGALWRMAAQRLGRKAG